MDVHLGPAQCTSCQAINKLFNKIFKTNICLQLDMIDVAALVFMNTVSIAFSSAHHAHRVLNLNQSLKITSKVIYSFLIIVIKCENVE